jgi:hypothetical protein
MRLAIILTAAALVAAPAIAQRVVPAPDTLPDQAPPPEGFYKDIPNMYDLLARPVPLGNLTLVNGRRICPATPTDLTDEQRKTLLPCRTEKFVSPLVPQPRRKE